MAKHPRDLEKEAYWRKALQRFSASGLSVREFCKREQLAESAFYAWRRTIGKRDGQSASSAKSRAPQTPAFAPVTVTDEPRREAGLSLELVGGRVLRLPETVGAAWLAEFMHALEAQTER